MNVDQGGGRSWTAVLRTAGAGTALLALATSAAGCGVTAGPGSGGVAATNGATAPSTPSVGSTPSTGSPPSTPSTPSTRSTPSTPSARSRITYPRQGPGTWRVAGGGGREAGSRGRLLRYVVTVEDGITGVDPDDVARQVETTLADPRGWAAGGAWRFRRVGSERDADVAIRLVTPGTRDRLCADRPEGYTSCRIGDQVVLNVARWTRGVPGYGAPLAVYRQYMINHELGHRLGRVHETCPGPGLPAPVMQQQTLGLHGCSANPWPLRAGRPWSGPAGSYGDPIPAGP